MINGEEKSFSKKQKKQKNGEEKSLIHPSDLDSRL